MVQSVDPVLSRIARKAAYLSADDERTLIGRAQTGDKTAHDRVILAHLRLVLAEVVRFKKSSIPLDDLVHEGILGLAEALGKFDLNQGVRFSSYAHWWMKERIRAFVFQNANSVRMTNGTRSVNRRLFFQSGSVRSALERDGRLSASEIDQHIAAQFGATVAQVERMRGNDVSMNDLVGDEPGLERGDLIADDASQRPDKIVADRIDSERRRDAIEIALATLTERERVIVRARHYAEDGDEETLDMLGGRFGVSKERIRQIEVKALEKLRQALAPKRDVLELAA